MTNNIQQIREQLQELYITMGQDQLAENAKDLFKSSQMRLSKTLDQCIKRLGLHLKTCCDSCLSKMQLELMKLGKQNSNLSQAVDLVFQSFIPQLNEKLDDLHEHIEQMPFFKILKIVWNFIIDGIRTQIILNPQYVNGFPGALNRQSKRSSLSKFQIDVIVNMLDSLEEYFHQNGEGNTFSLRQIFKINIQGSKRSFSRKIQHWKTWDMQLIDM